MIAIADFDAPFDAGRLTSWAQVLARRLTRCSIGQIEYFNTSIRLGNPEAEGCC